MSGKKAFVSSWVLVALTAIAIGGCKPRAASTLRAAEDGKVNVSEITGQLAEINGMLIKHTVMGVPLIEAAPKEGAQPAVNTLPTPPRCEIETWKNDPRWASDPVMTLEGYARGANDLRVKSAAIEALSVVGTRHGLTCAEDHVAELLGQLKNPQGAFCDTFARCAIVVSLLGSVAQLSPELPELPDALTAVEANVKTMSGGANTRSILEFKLASFKTHADLYRVSGLNSSKNEGEAIVLEDADRKRIKDQLSKLYAQAYKRLFVVNQMRDNLNISPELVKRMITQDMLDGVDFKTLEKDVQDLLLQEALGFYDSAWQMQLFNQSLQVYVDRLAQDDPRPWLEKVKTAAKKWSGDNDSFDFEGLSLADDAASGTDESWEGGVNPRVAFFAMTQFVDREAKLPWRRAWTQATAVVFELIPPEVRDLNIKANFLKAMRAGAEHRKAMLATLEGRGLTQATEGGETKMSAADVEKAKKANEEVRRVVSSLLDNEEGMAGYFSHFNSVYDDFLELYDRMGDRMVVIQNVISKMQAGDPGEEARDELLSRLDGATTHALDQWLKIRCEEVLYRASQSSSVKTVIKEPFFLDSQINIDFECAPQTTGDEPSNIAQLRSRIGRYTGNITYKRAVDRGLTKIKEAAAIGMLLVIGLPAGIAGNAAAAGARYVLVNAARAGLVHMLRKQLVRRLIAGAINLYVNVTVFNLLHGLSDKAWNGMLGIEHPPAHEETWGQYIFHTMQGMAVFASLHHVSRFSSGIAKRLTGLGGSAGKAELSTLVSKYRTTLKPTWKMTTAEFAIGTGVETGLFFAMPYASEFLGTKVLGVYEDVSPEEKAFQRLYSPGWSETLKDSFATAVLFRTFGLLHGRGNMPENAEFNRFRESVRNSLTGEMSKDQAFTVLGVQQGAGADGIKSAYRKLSAKYHPDRIDATARRTMEEPLPPAEASKISTKLMTAASNNTPFETMKTELGLSQQQAAIIEPAYRQIQDNVQMFKRVQTAYQIVSGS